MGRISLSKISLIPLHSVEEEIREAYHIACTPAPVCLKLAGSICLSAEGM
jgi:hypothetical protein